VEKNGLSQPQGSDDPIFDTIDLLVERIQSVENLLKVQISETDRRFDSLYQQMIQQFKWLVGLIVSQWGVIIYAFVRLLK